MAGIDNAVFRPGTIRAAVEAIGLLDRLDGRRRVHADDFAVVHVRTDRPR